MNVKNFLVAGFIGGIVDFLLGWVLYGMLFKDIYPQNEETKLHFIFFGCLTFGLLISFIFTKWAGITNPLTGLSAGATIGFIMGLSMNFFMYSSMPLNINNFITDVVISVIIGAGVGTTVAIVNGKMK